MDEFWSLTDKEVGDLLYFLSYVSKLSLDLQMEKYYTLNNILRVLNKSCFTRLLLYSHYYSSLLTVKLSSSMIQTTPHLSNNTLLSL